MALPELELDAFVNRAKKLRFTLLGADGLPINITGYTLTWTLSDGTSDATPILDFDTADPNFVIETQSGSTLGQATLTLSNVHMTQTARTYFWDLKYNDGSNTYQLYPPSPFVLQQVVTP